MKKVFYADGLFFFSIGCMSFPLIVMNLTMKTALLIRREARPKSRYSPHTRILQITIAEKLPFCTRSPGSYLPNSRDLSRNSFPPFPIRNFSKFRALNCFIPIRPFLT